MKATAAAPPKAATAGLANDWLRQQDDIFKAWDIGAEFRSRYDIKDNAGAGSSPSVDFMKDSPPGSFNDNAYLQLREKVHLGYSPVNWFTAFAEARDSSSTGDQRDPNKDADQFDLHQAYLKLGNPQAFPLAAKVGRQELVYGDERIIGRSDWNNLGRVFDAGVVRFERPAVWVDAFAGRVVMPDNHNFNMPNDYDWLFGGYASSDTWLPFQESQVYFVAHNVSKESAILDPGWLPRASTPQDTYTPGFRFKSLPGKLEGWDYSLEAGAQFGNVKITTPSGTRRLEQQAFTVMANGGYTWKEAWGTPRLGLGYDFASGDGDPNDDRNGTFEPVFPTNHKPFGLMDLIGQKNIHDPRVTFSVNPVKQLAVSLECHSYWLAATEDYFYSDSGTARIGNGYGRHPEFSGHAGSELSLDAIWTARPWIVLRGGYGHFFVGDYVQDSLAISGGASDANWLYAQLTLRF